MASGNCRYLVRIPAFRIDTENLLSRLAEIYSVPEEDLSYEWDGVRVRQDNYPSGYYVVSCKKDWRPHHIPLTGETIKSLRLPRPTKVSDKDTCSGVDPKPSADADVDTGEASGSGSRSGSGPGIVEDRHEGEHHVFETELEF